MLELHDRERGVVLAVLASSADLDEVALNAGHALGGGRKVVEQRERLGVLPEQERDRFLVAHFDRLGRNGLVVLEPSTLALRLAHLLESRIVVLAILREAKVGAGHGALRALLQPARLVGLHPERLVVLRVGLAWCTTRGVVRVGGPGLLLRVGRAACVRGRVGSSVRAVRDDVLRWVRGLRKSTAGGFGQGSRVRGLVLLVVVELVVVVRGRLGLALALGQIQPKDLVVVRDVHTYCDGISKAVVAEKGAQRPTVVAPRAVVFKQDRVAVRVDCSLRISFPSLTKAPKRKRTCVLVAPHRILGRLDALDPGRLLVERLGGSGVLGPVLGRPSLRLGLFAHLSGRWSCSEWGAGGESGAGAKSGSPGSELWSELGRSSNLGRRPRADCLRSDDEQHRLDRHE